MITYDMLKEAIKNNLFWLTLNDDNSFNVHFSLKYTDHTYEDFISNDIVINNIKSVCSSDFSDRSVYEAQIVQAVFEACEKLENELDVKAQFINEYLNENGIYSSNCSWQDKILNENYAMLNNEELKHYAYNVYKSKWLVDHGYSMEDYVSAAFTALSEGYSSHFNDDNFYEKTDLLANVALNYLEKNCVLKYCDMYEDFESFSKNIYTDIKLMNSILPQKVFMQYSNLNDADKLNIYYEKKVLNSIVK